MKRFLILLALLALVLIVVGCSKPAENVPADTNKGEVVLVLDKGRAQVWFWHDTEHHVGVWLCTEGIAVLPDEEYQR